ncbi:hypothetical protein CIHG_09371 [Coccidioides immitis H538.4]|uniref:Uncharacterized protein n=2 Tax=Coccidioides immitis TaxID=5501 RepID=A0A0J8S2B9_COCIT|nr:hypothetical protein CIRG_02532 [Coccidioides immitis RMSCC 2394]KMU91560.1 hypothetical protein CIHG_09371 [Coccidioides immitis H538.4]
MARYHDLWGIEGGVRTPIFPGFRGQECRRRSGKLSKGGRRGWEGSCSISKGRRSMQHRKLGERKVSRPA